jgi:hypothetical protein
VNASFKQLTHREIGKRHSVILRFGSSGNV